jgi:hypothetical protein
MSHLDDTLFLPCRFYAAPKLISTEKMQQPADEPGHKINRQGGEGKGTHLNAE